MGDAGGAEARRLPDAAHSDSLAISLTRADLARRPPAGRDVGLKPGGAGRLRFATAIALNNAPISPLPLPTSRFRAWLQFLRPLRPGALGKRLRSEIDADRAQEIALVDRAVHGRAGRGGAAGHRGEIDVRGEIAFPGHGERVDEAMGAQRLQRVAEPGHGMAVVDHERRATLLHEPRAELEHETMAGRIDLQHLPVARVPANVRLGRLRRRRRRARPRV